MKILLLISLKINLLLPGNVFVDAQVENHTILFSQIASPSHTYQLYSHGRPGELLINGRWKNASEIARFLQPKIQHSALKIDNLNIYGCEFAKGQKGLEAVVYLQKTLGVSVSASTNITGKDGDWNLEVGQDKEVIALNNFKGNLQCANFGTGDSQDYDCDGVINSLDLDDDNDGILDTSEMTCVDNPPACSTNILERALVTSGVTLSNQLALNYGMVFGLTQTFSSGVITSNTCGAISLGQDATIWDNTFSVKFVNPFDGVTPQALKSFSVKTDCAAYNEIYSWDAYDINGNFLYNQAFPASGSNQCLTITPAASNVYSIRIHQTSSAATIYGITFTTPCKDRDTDGDGIPDRLDLDSDGDGCPDAKEGGSALNPTINSTMPGGNTGTGYNGTSSSGVALSLCNSSACVSNAAATLGVPTVALPGQSVGYSENKAFVFCTDSDGDGIPDVTDLDDDNDGILDAVESPSCFYSATELASPSVVKTGFELSAGTIANVYDNNTSTSITFVDTYYSNALNKTVFEVTPTVPTVATSIILNSSSASLSPIRGLDNTSVLTAQGWNGTAWVDILTYTATPVVSGNIQTFAFPSNTTAYQKYRLFEPPGTYGVRIYSSPSITEVTLGIPATYIPSANPKPTCTGSDFDGDGIPNYLDLDSDNDGCSDAYESGVTTQSGVSMTTGTSGTVGGVALANSVVVGPWGANGFANSVETAAESGVYKGTYTYANAINSGVHTCPVCKAGTTAPTHGAALNNVCPATTANLSTFATSACPTGSSLEWHTSTTVSAATLYATPTTATAGTYYATCHDVTNNCYSPASTGVVVTINPLPSTPTIGTITQPTCSTATGSVILNGLPSSGTWTIASNPAGYGATGSGTSTTISSLPAGNTYTFTVTNSNGCTSVASANVVINAQPATPTAPTIGTITQPTCSTTTGSVILNGLPAAGTWTIVSNPAGYGATGTGTSKTISSLPAGTYTFTVTNASACTSVASANVVINAQPATPTAPTIGTITQPSCNTATGSVILNGLPSSGTWTIVSNPVGYGTSGTGTSTTISNLPAGNSYTFTVTNASTCTSVASASAAINAQPATPTAPTIGTITQPTCNTATGSVVLSGLPAAGTWTIVSNPVGYGTSGTGTSTTISNLPAGNSYTFTVTNASGCTSVASASAVIIAQPASPTPPVLSPATICTGNSTVLTASTNCTNSAVLTWYSDAGLTTLLGSTSVSPPATTTYYAICVLGPCKSTTASVIISVVTPPSAPTATPSSICTGGTATLSATCSVGTLTWYSDSGLSLVISNTPTALITTTYYGACLTANCKSTGTPVTVTVGTMSAPSALSATKTTICSGSTNLTGTCATGLLVWYPNNTFTTALSSATVSPTSTSSYYASCESGACILHNTTPNVITVVACAVLTNDASTYTPGSVATINLVSNDTNVDVSTITLSGTGTLSSDGKSLFVAGQGTWTVNSGGVLTFTPSGTFTGNPTPISYTANNNSGNPAATPATVTLTALPVLTNDASTYTPGSVATINLVSNDSNVDVSTITLSGTGTLSSDGKSLFVAGQGTWAVNSGGVLTFTPSGTFTGNPTPISYTANNNSGNPAATPATVTLTALPVLTNDASTYTPGSVATINLVSNDSNVDVSTITLSGTGTLSSDGKSLFVAGQGTWAVNSGGVLTFTPSGTFTGNPTPISYTANNNSGNPAATPATVTLTALPVLTNDASTYTPGSVATINLVSNDSNVDVSTITLSGTGTLSSDGKSLFVAGQGTWAVNSGGVLTFTPSGTFTGNPTPISYTANNNSGNPAATPATVTLTALPVLTNDASTYTPGSVATINLVSNDSNVDVSTITLSGTGTLSSDGKSLFVAGQGTWAVNSGGVLTFTPSGTFTGNPTPISYTANNNSGNPAATPATVTLTALPVLTNDASTYTPGSVATITLTINDSNVDVSTITLSGTGTLSSDGKSLFVAGQGTWAVNSGGVLTFTPSGTFTGNPTPISYTANNNLGNPAATPATVTLTALPVLTNDASTYTPGSVATITLTSNDSNVDVSTITLSGTGTLSSDGKSLFVAGQGTWAVNSGGVLTFTPSGTFTGNPTPISYTANNNSGNPAATPATVTLTALPVLTNDASTYTPGSVATINLVSNDSNVDVSTITLSGTGTLSSDGKSLFVAGQGTWAVNSGGVLTFTPSGTFTGNPTPISYTANNNSGNPAATPATVTLTALPVLTNDASTYTPGSVATITLTSNDSNVDVSSITLSGTGTLSSDGKSLVVTGQGTWAVNSGGVLTFTPSGTFTGTPTPISYTANNNSGNPAATPASVTLTALPVLTNDASTYTPGSVATITLTSNDSNVDVSSITLSGTGTLSSDGKSLVVTGQGTWTVSSGGVLTFTPSGTFTGNPTPISYTANNNSGNPAATPATVTLTALPVLTNDASTYTPGSVATITLTSNDSNVDVSSITLSGTGTLSSDGKSLVVPNQGTWAVNSGGVLTFTPSGTFTGTPTPISYTANNNSGNPAATPATVTLTALPVLTNDASTYTPGSVATITLTSNDSNVDVSSITLSGTGTLSSDGKSLVVPNQGTWAVNSGGVLTFTPSGTFTGTPTPISYTANNNSGNPAATPATVTLTALPVLTNDASTYTPGSVATITLTSNDSNVDVSSITLSGTGTLSSDGKSLVVPNQGTWAVNSGGVLTFTPSGTFTGNPTPISYTANNNSGNPAATPATVTLTALPVLTNDASTYTPGSVATITLTSNDSNVDVSSITLSGTGTLSSDGKSLVVPNQGTWAVNSGGVLTFTPSGTFTGNPTPISYTANNNSGNPATTPATITLTALPVLTNDTKTFTSGTPVKVDVVGNDTNVDPTTVTIIGATSADGTKKIVAGEGTWKVNSATGEITFTPEATFTGTPTPINYTAKNASGTAAATPATVTLTPIAAPTASNDTGILLPNSSVTVNVLSNDANTIASTVHIIDPVTGLPVSTLTVLGGHWDVNADGSITYTQTDATKGLPTPITYSVANAAGTTTTATVTLTTAPNPGPLNVTLINFEAQKEEKTINLTWTTAEEINADRFEVLRSADAKVFESIGTVKAKGNSQINVNYSLTDTNPSQGLNYYRLKSIDFDGSVQLSNIIQMRMEYNGTVGPNPVVSSSFNIFDLNIKDITITNINNQNIEFNTIKMQNGINIILNENLQSGVYILKYLDRNNTIITRKLVVLKI